MFPIKNVPFRAFIYLYYIVYYPFIRFAKKFRKLGFLKIFKRFLDEKAPF